MNSDRTPLNVIAVGDLAFNGRFHQQLRQLGPAYPFAAVKEHFQRADFRTGNLESPITTAPRVAAAKLTLRGAAQATDVLTDSGFHCVTLANNHMMDFGAAGLLETCSRLEDAGVAHVGAGRNLDEASAPAVLVHQGKRIGVLGCCDVEQVSQLYAGKKTPGVAGFDKDRWFADIRNIRDHVDYLIVHMHWGVEMSRLPTAAQRTLAARMADSGVDLVLGHHPHVVQPVDRVGGMPVAYSLGDCLFSSTFWHGSNGREAFVGRYQVHPLSRQTGWLEVALGSGEGSEPVFRPAVLGADLRLREDSSTARKSNLASLLDVMSDNHYQAEVEKEHVRASKRDRWRFDHGTPLRRLTLKLLQWRCLPNAYVEPDGVHWRDPFVRTQSQLNRRVAT